MAPEWERLTAHIEADPESKEKLGWVREMYAFSVAMALKRVKPSIVGCPRCPLIAQPPADKALGGAAMFHYTWGTVFMDSFGRKIWEFDKRTYTAEEIQRKVGGQASEHSICDPLPMLPSQLPSMQLLERSFCRLFFSQVHTLGLHGPIGN